METIAIVGAGNVGRSLGLAFAGLGHQIRFGVRDPADPRHADLKKNDLSVQATPLAALEAETIILATPWTQTRSALDAAGDLSGKVVIDATNPFVFIDGKPSLSWDNGLSAVSSAAQALI
jgi:8-hydroxy-5-deazaflavin:NADPH oxidoreductase